MRQHLITRPLVAATALALAILFGFAFGSGAASAASQPSQPTGYTLPITMTGELVVEEGGVTNTLSVEMTGTADLATGKLSLTGTAGTDTVSTTADVKVTSLNGVTIADVVVKGPLTWATNGITATTDTLHMAGQINADGPVSLKGTFGKSDLDFNGQYTADVDIWSQIVAAMLNSNQPLPPAAQPDLANNQPAAAQPISPTLEVWEAEAAGDRLQVFVTVPGIRPDQAGDILDSYAAEVFDPKGKTIDVELVRTNTISDTKHGTLTVEYVGQVSAINTGEHILLPISDFLGHPVPEARWTISPDMLPAVAPTNAGTPPTTGTAGEFWAEYGRAIILITTLALAVVGAVLVLRRRNSRA